MVNEQQNNKFKPYIRYNKKQDFNYYKVKLTLTTVTEVVWEYTQIRHCSDVQ